MRIASVVLALLFSHLSHAALVEIDYTFDLSSGIQYQCIDGSDTSTGMDSNCFSNSAFNGNIANTTMSVGDTIRIDVTFVPGQRLRWSDDGNTNFDLFSENFQVGLFGPQTDTVAASRMSYLFKEVSGHNTTVSGEQTFAPGSMASGGVVVNSDLFGITNITDSFFEFTGLTVEYDLSEIFSGGLTTSADSLAVFFTSGNFEVLEDQNTNVTVPAPSSILLLLSFWAGLAVRSLKKS